MRLESSKNEFWNRKPTRIWTTRHAAQAGSSTEHERKRLILA